MNKFKNLNSINEIVYVIDLESNTIVYINSKAKEEFRIAEYGKKLKCYNCLNDDDTICESCSNKKFLSNRDYSWIKHHHNNGRDYLFHDKIIDIEGKKYRIGIIVDISKIEENISQLDLIFEIESKLDKCEKILNPAKNFDSELIAILDTILEYYDGDRIYILDFDWEKMIFKKTVEKCRKDVKSEIIQFQDITLDIVDKLMKLFENKAIVSIDNIENLYNDEKYKIESNLLEKKGIKSILAGCIFYDGEVHGVVCIDNPRNNKNNMNFLKHIIFFITNEIQKNKLTMHLQQLSYVDMATNLYNRNAYNEKVEIIDSFNYKFKGVIFVDMNGLKYINDTFGHKYGDNKIKHLANILRKYFGKEEVFRISGDEFVILCIDKNFKDFTSKVENLKKELILDEKGLASVGCVWNDSNTKIEILEQEAERLMYIDKNNYYINDASYNNKKRPLYIDKMIENLNKDEYLIYLQPIYSLKTNSIYGAEALVRKKDSEGNIITPAEFIHIFEKEKLISYIDFLVFEKVCETLVRWEKKGYCQYSITSNFSRITLVQDGFVKRILEICDRTGVNCSRLTFEITESSNDIQLEKLSNVMSRLKQRGIKFALDDIGSQYSTINMLVAEEIDVAKIDRSLIKKLTSANRNKLIIENLIAMFQKINMVCVSEGVETKEEYELLANMNCDRIQGYLIGKPMPVEEFEKNYLEKTFELNRQSNLYYI
ncbi:EAL domain-containing protein [Terrisporobacter sp.]